MSKMKIRNWDKWQSYRKDRGQPPWIKIHRSLMRDIDWVTLTDAQRGQLVSIWMLGADHDGVIPSDPSIIKKLCFMDSPLDLKVFEAHGFLCNSGRCDASVTSERRQHDQPETETETETERETERETEKEKEKNSVAKKTGDAVLQVPDDLKPYEATIKDWLQYKVEKGQRYKPTGLKSLWGVIRRIPAEQREASIRYSMGQNWSGIFQEAKNGHKKHDGGNLAKIGEPEREDSKFAGIVRTVRND